MFSEHIFGMTAKEWSERNPSQEGNMRDGG